MKKRNFLEKQYEESFAYLKKMKNFIYITIGIFLLFALIGFFVPIPEKLSEVIFNYIEGLLAQTKGFSYSQWFGFIFLNNIVSSFFSSFLGVFLGIYSIMATLVNGYLIGFVSKLSVVDEGVISLWRLFPHGIFELPAIFISFASGLKLGSFVFQKKKEIAFRFFMINTLRIFVFIVIPLLFVAALIESAFIFFG